MNLLNGTHMNPKTKQLLEAAGFQYISHDGIGWAGNHNASLPKLVELVAQHCADVCMEMAAKCAGLEGDGALAKDCAYWIKEDFEL